MRGGQLRHRLQLIKFTYTNVGGQLKPTETVEGTYWAGIMPLSGTETVRAQQVRPETTHIITMRYGAPVTTEDQLRLDTRKFNILHVANTQEKNRWLEITAKEV